MTGFEDILVCPTAESIPGIKTRLYYAPESSFYKFELPDHQETYEDYLMVSPDAIMFKSGNWNVADVLIDESELQSTITGNLQRKKTKISFSFFLLGFRTKVLGFVEKCKNNPMIFGVEDLSGRVWLVGNLRNRAFIESAEGTTGRKYEDNSGVSVKVTSNSQLYCYEGSAQMITRMRFFDKYFDQTFE